MTKSNQAQSQITYPHINRAELTEIIDGVVIAVGVNLHQGYNLSNLKFTEYQIKANGQFNKKYPVLNPLEWIKSTEGQQHISKIYNSSDRLLQISGYYPLCFFTHSRYIWLGYLKHCIGNIDDAISGELAE